MTANTQPAKNAPASGDSGFSEAQCTALFAAVLVHDEIDLDAALPDTIQLDYSPEQFAHCYGICRQLWRKGVDRQALDKMIANIRRNHLQEPEDQQAFKHIRARFKHLRFAYVVCDQRHRYPALFHLLTAFMGHLQDAFKNGQSKAVNFNAAMTRLLLRRLAYALIQKEIDSFKPSSTASFRQYLAGQTRHIRQNLTKTTVTSKEFHQMRKVISRQVAFYDNLKTLYPSNAHQAMSTCLSTINGLMGGLHDELVSKKFSKTQNYKTDTFAIPEPVRVRLEALVLKYDEALQKRG